MNIVMEQPTKAEKKDEQIKRLIAYYKVFTEMKGMSFDVEWDFYMRYVKDKYQNFEIYKSFFKIDNNNEKVIKETYDVITALDESKDFEETNVDEETIQETNHIWKNIIQFFEKEANWEKQIYDMLNKTAENHPLIAKAIVILLTGILLGLVEDCIHDAIQMKNQMDVIESSSSTVDDWNESEVNSVK